MGLPVEVNNLMMGSLGGYTVGRSLRFRSSASAYLNWTSGTPTNNKIWTYSLWVKRGKLGAEQELLNANSVNSQFYFSTSDTLNFYDGTAGATYFSTQVFRDPSAWYHILVAEDTTQATAGNRVKIYVNGVQITAFSTGTAPTQNNASAFNVASTIHTIGRYNPSTTNYLDGYLAEVNFVDGQALTPSSFGETDAITGVWNPKKYSGTYGTNGFYLNFSDNSAATATTIGKDSSGNGNNWTPNNISVTAGTTYDSMIDSPTPYADGNSGRGNYAVWNPLFNYVNKTITEGNLNFNNTTTASPSLSTIGVNSGKWYAEFTFATSYCNVGIANANLALSNYIGSDTNGFGLLSTNGNLYYNATAYAYGSSFTTSDTMMLAFDVDNKKIYWGKNGTWFNSGNPATGTNAGVAPSGGTVTATIDTTQLWFFATGTTSLPNGSIINFGQRPFSYTPPSGFKALNTYNLPAASISNGAKHFDALTWSGSGGSSRSITGLNFQPDFVWSKVRNTTYGHMFFDSVRGAGSGKELGSNSTGAEGYAVSSQYGYLSAFNSNGFTVTAGSDASIPNAYWNQSGNTYVGWQWKGGGTAVTNNSGTISSQVSANTSAGFSIVTYTGTGANATVGHGLGVAPNMVLFKARNSAIGWDVYHSSVGNTAALALNSTGAAFTSSTFFNNTSPSSTVITLGTDANLNGSGTTFVAYCFAAVSGYSAFGSYSANGSTDGPFIYTGFRPRFILSKRTDSSTGGNWQIEDTSRATYNAVGPFLRADTSDAEGSGTLLDILSNGFKLRTTDTGWNASGGTYIWAAFCENPFKYSRAR